jgi:hypothetical protein
MACRQREIASRHEWYAPTLHKELRIVPTVPGGEAMVRGLSPLRGCAASDGNALVGARAAADHASGQHHG